MLSDFGVTPIFDGKSTLLQIDGGPNQTNQSPVRSPVSNSRAYGQWLCGLPMYSFHFPRHPGKIVFVRHLQQQVFGTGIAVDTAASVLYL